MGGIFKRNPAAMALAMAVLLQAVGAVALGRPGMGAAVQILLIGLALAAATHELWRNRMRLDHHVDMLIVMAAFGGLGMLAGTAVDLAIEQGTPQVHGAAGMAQEAGQRAAHGHGERGGGPSWGRFLDALFSWMTGLMILGGIPPTWWMTRCASLANESWRRWFAVHIAGNAGMIVGMILAGMSFGHALGMRMGAMVTGHHVAMVIGMIVGMEICQVAAEAVLGLKPWRVRKTT